MNFGNRNNSIDFNTKGAFKAPFLFFYLGFLNSKGYKKTKRPK